MQAEFDHKKIEQEPVVERRQHSGVGESRKTRGTVGPRLDKSWAWKFAIALKDSNRGQVEGAI